MKKPGGHGVIFFLMGTGHAVELVVSIKSLRNHYSGPISLLTPEPNGIAGIIAADRRLDLTITPIEVCQQRRHSAHVTKTWLHRFTPFDVNILIDADTIVMGTPLPLLADVTMEKVVLTQFANWKMCRRANGEFGLVAKRVHSFAEGAGVLNLFHRQIDQETPALNTGVMAFHRLAPMLEPVHDLAVRGHRKFIPDECAAQLLHLDYPHVLVDDRWNCSPIYGVSKDPVIFHCHGSKVLADRTRKIWLDLLNGARRENLGGLADWMGEEHKKKYQLA